MATTKSKKPEYSKDPRNAASRISESRAKKAAAAEAAMTPKEKAAMEEKEYMKKMELKNAKDAKKKIK